MRNDELRAYRKLTAFALFIIGAGMVFYHFVEGFGWVDSFYFCVVSLTTVGYGDLSPQTTLGRLVTPFYLITGIGIITAFISARLKYRARQMQAKQDKKTSK